MKKNWLRGLLLGASLALFMAGGVALAQNGLYNYFNKDCVECWAGEGEPTLDPYLVEWTAGGWDPQLDLCITITVDGEVFYDDCGSPPPNPGFVQDMSYPCEWDKNPASPASLLGREVSLENGAPGPLGMWVYQFQVKDLQGTVIDSASDSLLVAEICEEFVPEPGTMVLLSSGLAGLAGYAALRWRTRE